MLLNGVKILKKLMKNNVENEMNEMKMQFMHVNFCPPVSEVPRVN